MTDNIKNDSDYDEIKTKSIASIKWTYLAQLSSQFIQPLIVLALIFILTPEEFGVMGIATIAISIAQIIQDFGFEKTLIQRQTRVEDCANIVFWVNTTVGVVIYALIFFIAPFIAAYFDEPMITDVLRVLCIQIMLVSLITVHSSLLQRNFGYRKIFNIQLISSFTPIIITIPLALNGFGVWSLVFGTLASSLIQLSLYWRFSGWRPKLKFDVALARELFGFGTWVTLEMVMGWLITEGDSIILGAYFGVYELGVYRTGLTFIKMIFNIFLNPIIPVIYSSFSRLKDKSNELKISFLQANKIITIVAFPVGLGLIALSQPISTLVFRGKWDGIEYVIIFLGLMNTVSWLVGINPSVYRALGRPDINVKLLFLLVIYYIPMYIIAAPLGLAIFCIFRAGVAILSLPLHFYLVKKYLKLKFLYIFNYFINPLVASIVMCIIIYLMSSQFKTYEGIIGWIIMIALAFIGAIIYISILYITDKMSVWDMFHLAKKVIK